MNMAGWREGLSPIVTVLPCIITQNDVVQATGNVKSGFAGPAVILLESNYYAIYQA